MRRFLSNTQDNSLNVSVGQYVCRCSPKKLLLGDITYDDSRLYHPPFELLRRRCRGMTVSLSAAAVGERVDDGKFLLLQHTYFGWDETARNMACCSLATHRPSLRTCWKYLRVHSYCEMTRATKRVVSGKLKIARNCIDKVVFFKFPRTEYGKYVTDQIP